MSGVLVAVMIMGSVQRPEHQEQWMPPNGELKNWRKHMLMHLKQVCERKQQSELAQDAKCSQMDIYQFGVFTGRSLKPMAKFSAHYSIGRRIWGFDSFSGLPTDSPVAHKSFKSRRGQAYTDLVKNGGFHPGSFSAMQTVGASSIAGAVKAVYQYVDSDRIRLIPGYFNESLTRSLASSRAMRPAIYVDIDVDIYSATYEALDWLLRSKLIVNGTIIGYDDFNYGMPQAHGRSWKQIQRSGQLEGEPRAHSEIETKWGVRFVHERRAVPISGGQSGWLFTTLMPS